MLIDSLTYILKRTGALEHFWGKLDCGEDAALGIASSARPFAIAARFSHHPQPTLVIIAGEENAQLFSRNIASYLGDERVLFFPDRADLPFLKKKADPTSVAKRLCALNALSAGREVVVVASAQSLLRTLPPIEAHVHLPLIFEAEKELIDMPQAARSGIMTFDDVLHALEERGYENTGNLSGPGTFTTRGGVIDIYPGNLTHPVRLDFFGDELEEIRHIVPSTKQTIASLSAVEVYPVREFISNDSAIARVKTRLERPSRTNPALRELFEELEGGLHFEGAEALMSYLYDSHAGLSDYARRNTLITLIEPKSLFDDALHAYDRLSDKAHGTNIALDGLYFTPAKLNFGKGQCATYLSIMRVGTSVDDDLPVKRTEVSGHPEKLFGRLRHFVNSGFTTIFSIPGFRARQDMKLALVDEDIPFVENLDVLESVEADKSVEVDKPKDAPLEQPLQSDQTPSAGFTKMKKGVVNIVDVEIPLGMVIPKAHLALVSIFDTAGSAKKRRSRAIDITEVTFPYKPGDYVVHAAHGIGKFTDLVKQTVDDVTRDYLLIEYAEGDKLYVPIEQLDRVTRYVGPKGDNPRLTRLNTADWSHALNKARKATKKLAFDLVDVYARRSTVSGYRFSPDTAKQHEMELDFPYQETPDQLTAIAEVKADMQAARPMDRLICGDVGFGKTEVAMRAAFKATQDLKQVMILCPTTILAQQHFTSFKERFDPYEVRVEIVSRFKTKAEQRHILDDFSEGKVDVLVGTHRLLSRDVNPYDLGLIIIDEEQRFGVGHKEQFKNLRESIDVLTMSATPIPRTMQMSLSGVRDMSLIMTPPDERRPVEVHVGEWDPDVVSAAIRYELARSGQVYYVSNRVKSIDHAVERVREAAGEARIGVAHGQMSKDDLEKMMEDFSAGLLDVLIATTIIESGIDNPHTNTLIIEDAQRLGLSQMYQLKGRVGRSSTQAYAYFMFPDTVPLTDEAVSRLNALYEHQDLGSGIRIALRDLEIRGAGSMLGAEQHGNMSAVGFDLFAQMLANAVNATKEGRDAAAKELPPALSDITLNIPVSSYFSDEYIPDADERILWYRRLASATVPHQVSDLEEEMVERFGPLPDEGKNMIAKARIKAWAFEHHLRLISLVAGKVVIEPLVVPRSLMPSLRRAHATYSKERKRLQIPLKYFGSPTPEELLDDLYAFLCDLEEEKNQSEK